MKFYGTDEFVRLLPLADDMLRRLDAPTLTESLAPLTWFVERAADGPGIKLAPSGRLGRNFVQDGDVLFKFSGLARIDRVAQNEDDVPTLVELRSLTRTLGFTRTHKGYVVATAAGRRELDATTCDGCARTLRPRMQRVVHRRHLRWRTHVAHAGAARRLRT